MPAEDFTMLLVEVPPSAGARCLVELPSPGLRFMSYVYALMIAVCWTWSLRISITPVGRLFS